MRNGMGVRQRLLWSLSGMVMLSAVFAALLSSLGDPVRFSHRVHHDLELDCEECHPEVRESEMASDTNLPSVEVCRDCHDQFDGEVLFDAMQREVLFSHRLHNGLGIDCGVCHRVADPTGVGFPEMDLCLACHRKKDAPVACDACHEDLLEGKLMPGSHLAPAFVLEHKYEAREQREYCEYCHFEGFCAECHRGDNLAPRPHRRGFAESHSIEARKRMLNCQDCHEIEPFCVACHRDEMVLPLSHAFVDWSNREDGGKHRIEASLDIETCAFCHPSSDPVCEDCH